jgi:hypothetical protein
MATNQGTIKMISKFDLFLDQQQRFHAALEKFDSTIWFPPPRGNFKNDYPGNWFICFVPASWGKWKGAIYGVHFGFLYAREYGDKPERFRLAVGVESPLKEQNRQSFKENVVTRINSKRIKQSGFILKTENRKKLLETEPIPFSTDSWQIALEKYIALSPVVDVVAQIIKEYSDKGAFELALELR